MKHDSHSPDMRSDGGAFILEPESDGNISPVLLASRANDILRELSLVVERMAELLREGQ